MRIAKLINKERQTCYNRVLYKLIIPLINNNCRKMILTQKDIN
jgi:hypothetical protein